MNELFLYRDKSTEVDTPGLLVFNNEIVCFTLEDVDRGLTSTMSVKEIQAIKVYGQTAIPYGRYGLKWRDSAKFGRVPELIKVKGFSHILIHSGNDNTHTSGCLLVGMVKGENSILQSRDALKKVKLLMIDHNIKWINIEKMK